VKVEATNGPMVETAKVINAEIEFSNGFIHVINNVIWPKS
jgi:uncharacterized surface protein with fasciclin (FAS1) repeats